MEQVSALIAFTKGKVALLGASAMLGDETGFVIFHEGNEGSGKVSMLSPLLFPLEEPRRSRK